MRKGMYVVLTAALCLTLAVQASADLTARPWVGAAIGLNFPENTDLVFQAPPLKGVLGNAGLANGAWFGASAGLDLDGPLPFSLFGLMLDFTYNNLNFPAQTFSGGILPSSVASLTVPAMDGHQLSLDLLVRLRMPRLLDRLEPYAALGPGIVWTTVDFAPVGGSRQTSTDWALVAEAGLKVFLDSKHRIAADLAYRYRYCSPAFSFRREVNYVTVKGDSASHAVLLRLGYYF